MGAPEAREDRSQAQFEVPLGLIVPCISSLVFADSFKIAQAQVKYGESRMWISRLTIDAISAFISNLELPSKYPRMKELDLLLEGYWALEVAAQMKRRQPCD